MEMKKIALACDHAGFELKEDMKEYLTQAGFEVNDLGTHSTESVDYPDYALAAARAVAGGEADQALLVCGTGIGMAIAANKVAGIRAANCPESYCARMAREHNDANILTIGARVIGIEIARSIVEVFFNTEFSGGKHGRRLEKIAQAESREDK